MRSDWKPKQRRSGLGVPHGISITGTVMASAPASAPSTSKPRSGARRRGPDMAVQRSSARDTGRASGTPPHFGCAQAAQKSLATLGCRTMRIFQASFGALVLAVTLAGCAAPIGIRNANPIDVQRNLDRSALTGKLPSDFSLNQLRRYDLLTLFDKDPDAALMKLHEAALAEDFPPRPLFAL